MRKKKINTNEKNNNWKRIDIDADKSYCQVFSFNQTTTSNSVTTNDTVVQKPLACTTENVPSSNLDKNNNDINTDSMSTTTPTATNDVDMTSVQSKKNTKAIVKSPYFQNVSFKQRLQCLKGKTFFLL